MRVRNSADWRAKTLPNLQTRRSRDLSGKVPRERNDEVHYE